MKRHAAPIIAAVLLLLPVLYVGSYLVLVRPPVGIWVGGGGQLAHHIVADYRCCAEQARWFFWPLEQIDRKVRPGAWVRDEFWNTEERSGRAMPLPEALPVRIEISTTESASTP
jgi:hypothetical protein